MADGFELYHVPQQSRRDKLRVNTTVIPSSHPINNTNSFQFQQSSFYDPSLHLDLLTCAASHGFHPQSSNLLVSPEVSRSENLNPSVIIKGEGSNFMGFLQNPQNQNQSNNSTNSSSETQFYYPPAHNREFGNFSSQGLSLSLSSHNHNNNTQIPMELNFQYSTAPPGPFTGYTSVLKGSVFLRPAQILLHEICDVGGLCCNEKLEPDLSLLDPHSGFDDSGSSDGDGVSSQAKSRLISMLDEVYRKYKQYYHQVQAVVASFESIPGLNNAAPFANFALKSLSKHFKCLKSAIIDQLRFISKTPSTLSGRKHGHEDSSESDKFVLYNQRPIHSSTRIMDNQPVWRPQRGLPERAVSVLRSWLFEHFLHPYPTDMDKTMLAKQTGLSRSQVSNWFINARVRLWKPMVEEIHALETRQQTQQKSAATSSHTIESSQTHNPSSSNFKTIQDTPPEKRVRNELAELPLAVHHHGEPQLNMEYNHFGVGNYSNSSGVSLTLALHQNHHGINGLLDPFPPLGLDGCVVTAPGFETAHQNRHYGTRDVSVMNGQLLHDFVG